MKPYLLRLHRWLTLIFALPLAVVILTGLVLSFEPIAYDRAVNGKSVSLATVEQAIAKHDPQGRANTLSMRAYEGVMVLSEGRGGGASKRIDLATGDLVAPARGLWSDTLITARRLHESMLLDLRWLVDASTIAMLLSMILAVFMGWPFFRNSLGGWHRTISWGLLPLLILSPLSGLAIAYGITLAGPQPRVEGPPVPLAEAVKLVAAKHDLASVVWIRPQGGSTRARVYDGREAKVFAVGRAGLVEGPQNWPRAWHEGVFAGMWSGLMNVIISLAFVALMSTGLLIWARRTFRKRNSRQGRQPQPKAA